MSNLSSGQNIGGEATNIVQTLREFGPERFVPIRLIARLVGRDASETREMLDLLQSNKIVSLDSLEDSVKLNR